MNNANNKPKDPNKKVSKTVRVEQYLVDWVLDTGLSFSTYVRVFLSRRYNDAKKRGEDQANMP